jgi:ABC-2 type transport system permease protein
MRGSALRAVYVTFRIAHRDLLDFWKGKMTFAMSMLMPILFMSMFGFIYPTSTTPSNNPYKNAPMGLVVYDDRPFASQVAEQFREIARSTNLFVVQDFPTYESARGQIVAGNLYGVVVIPFGFTEAFESKRQTFVLITVDDTNPQLAAIIYGEANSIISQISAKLSASIIAKTGDLGDPAWLSEPASLERRDLVNGVTNSFEFLAPGFMALTVVMGTLVGLGSAIAREREQGTIDGLMVAPVDRSAIVIGKTLAQTVRGMIQGFVILGMSIILFGVKVYGNPGVMVLVMFLSVSSFVGMGIVMSAVAQDQESATMMNFLLQFPMMFLSGIIFPIQQLPNWLQYIGKALPLYYAGDALRKVVILNASPAQIAPDILILIVYSVVTLAMGMPLFRKAMTR